MNHSKKLSLMLGFVSLYNGEESRMSFSDRQKLLTILTNFGVDYAMDSSLQILVDKESQDHIQDLVARSFTQSLSVDTEQQKPGKDNDAESR